MAFTRDLDNLVPIMTSNTAPSGYVASCSSEYSATYTAYKALNGSDGSQDCWQATSPTGWLAIEFPSAKIINKINILPWYQNNTQAPKDFTFDGWTGSAWVTLGSWTNVTTWAQSTIKSFTFSNTTAYIKYRLNVTANNGASGYLSIGELELCATGQYASLIPTMTSNTAPSGLASASTELSTSYAAWKAMDGTSSKWSANTNTGTIQYQLAAAKTAKVYSIYGSETANESPNSWEFQGSTDGESWTTLDTQSNVVFLASTAKTYAISNTSGYTHYRLNITANNGGTYLSLGEFRVFGEDAPTGFPVPSPIFIC